MGQVGSSTALQTPFLDANNKVSWTWLKLLQQWQQQLAAGFDSSGNLKSNMEPTVSIVGRSGTIGSILQNIDASGVVQSIGLVSATDASQGAVILPAGATSNTLGSAAMEPSTAFDPAGSAAAAQSNAQTFATGAANTAQSNAEAFASNASNLSAGTVALPRLPGISATITTAALTPTGTQGSMTFTNGVLTAQVQST